MKYTITSFLKFFFFFVLVSSSVAGQIPVNDTIHLPPGYTLSQARWMNAIAVDANDNKWIAFKLIGLGKLSNPKVWTMYDSLNSPLTTNRILSVCCNASGVWAGTNSGLYNFNGTSWTSYTTSNSNIPSDTVPNLYSAGGNDLMIYSKKGFVYFNGTSFTPYNTGNSGLVNDSVQCVFQSSAGMWWIGTVHGLSSFDGTTWKSYTTANTFSCDDNIRSLNEDKNDTLFVGTNRGGVLIKTGAAFNPISKYLNNYFHPPMTIANLFQLSDGRIFFSNGQKEYIVSTNPISVNVKYADPYSNSSDTNFAITMDKGDRVWAFMKPISTVIRMTDSLLAYSDTLAPSENYKFNYLDINEVKCPMWNDNEFFWGKNSSPALYEVPKNECDKKAIFASALWIGGLDPGGQLHLGAQTYRASGSDFWPGPLDTLNATLDAATYARYDSIWKVNRYTVDEFITQYQLGNVTNGTYKIPNVILNWPAHGSGNYSRNLAPFIDANGDGLYNPYDGDYPEIKGDQMLWWVMNDNYNIHSESKCTLPLGVEIQSKAYAHSCQNISTADEAVNFTTFYSDSIINRTNTDYHDVYVGIWVDPDLGYYLDNLIGCRIDGDYGFCYSGSNFNAGSGGYGANPPMISVALLKGPQAEPGDGLDNNHDGVTDEPGENCMMNHFQYFNNASGATGNPDGSSLGLDFYNYMKSIWRDNTHVTYGGNGYGGATLTDYMYSGMPYDTGWVDTSPGDRRFLMSAGPFSLKAHQSKTLDYAIVFSWYKTAPNGLNTSVAKNDADVRKVKHWFETDSFPCVNSSIGIHEIEKNTNGLFIYPNPAQLQYAIVFKGNSKGEMELIDVTGRIVKQQTVFANQKNIVDVHDVAKGMYVVKVKDSQGISARKLIIE